MQQQQRHSTPTIIAMAKTILPLPPPPPAIVDIVISVGLIVGLRLVVLLALGH